MINIEKTISLHGYDPLMLTFGSGKKVWAECNGCGNGRWVRFCDYTDLCKTCSANTPEAIKANRLMGIAQFASQEARDVQRNRLLQFNKDHPEAGEEHSRWLIEYCKDPEVRKVMSDRMIQYHKDPKVLKAMSDRMIQYHKDHPDAGKEHGERLRNSYAMRVAIENQIGGHDIIDHHYIYDHLNPEKYTMKVTRSKHFKIHWWMKKAKIIVPHLNVTEDNKDIFKLKTKK